ncbi:MAG: M50 family metallopeptidase [Candidatus Saccharibacteria bacterium]|nr:M50 family metallopeptidase [Candidatus Saccharibacteria bacterium]
MDIVVGVIVGLFVLMLLVTAHEFGHFIMARRNGVRVLEFGIGFPPRGIAWVRDEKTRKWRRIPRADWKKEQKGLVFSLNWLPIGGFCQMDGESAEDERKGTFGAASFWAKTKILFGGVFMNWLVAFIILTILAWTGMPEFLEGQFTVEADTRRNNVPVRVIEVAEGSPAAEAGLLAGDKILAVDGNSFYHAYEFTDYNDARPGEEVIYTVERWVDASCPDGVQSLVECTEGEKTLDLAVKLNPADSEYLLGVKMETTQGLSYSTWSAPIVGAGLTVQITAETFKGVGQMVGSLVSGVVSQLSFDSSVRDEGRESISAVGDSVSGPVGIIGVLFPSFTAAGPTNLAFFTALISVSLACMNVLPIPALDGGRWLLIGYYKLRRKKLSKETEEKIVARAFMILLALMFLVTILDVVRIVR